MIRVKTVVCVAVLLAGCASRDVPLKNPAELDALIAEYERSAPRDAASDIAARIKTLNVNGGNAETATVDADLATAPIAEVVGRMLKAVQTSSVYRVPQPSGFVTARMTQLPFLQALNIVLDDAGLAAYFQDNTLVIDRRAVGNPPNSAIVRAQYQLRWMDTQSAAALLDSLESGQTTPVVQSGVSASTNSVVLVGPGDAVQRTLDLLREVDREAPHVVIEALVVEFDRDELERIGIDITNAAYKHYSDIDFSFGSLLGSAISFTRTAGAVNAKAFTAIIDFLESQDKARLLSRPYIATMSGVQASVNITRNRYVIVETPQQGATVTTPQAVTSGVILTITPTVTADNMIRTQLDVQDSQFIPTSENVAVETDQSHATTTMQVHDGESIIIGGLALDRRSSSNAGAPLLSRIPLLNLLFADRGYTRTQQEVMVILTPHLWHPGMELPLRQPEALRIRRTAPAPPS